MMLEVRDLSLGIGIGTFMLFAGPATYPEVDF